MLRRLLFLAVSVFVAVDSSNGVECPEGFTGFARKETHWCLGVFPFTDDLGHRETARSLCISLNSSLSIPENQQELDFLLKSYNRTVDDGIAMDGEMRIDCKALEHKALYRLNFANLTGPCGIKNELLVFDSLDTDPTFIKNNFQRDIPSRSTSHNSWPLKGFVGDFAACAVLSPIEEKGVVTYGDTAYCSGEKSYQPQRIHKVVCGRRPLV